MAVAGGARWRTAFQRRLWPSAILLSLPAIGAVLRNHPGTYVGDNRFEQYWAPGWRIVRETILWDGTRGMGRVGEEFWPITLPLGLLRSIGFSPAATEHIWHAVLLTLAALGIVHLVRAFQPRIGGAHLLAGLVYMCCPFSISFLVPSNLYWNYVLAPWLIALAIQGIRATEARERWRISAIWALLIFTAGDTDLPGLIFSVLWLAPVLVCAVHLERWVTWRQVTAWVGRAAALTVAVSMATIVKIGLGAGALGQRLLYTETPLQVNHSSSWTESFRGLGYWLSYFSSPGRSPDVPGGLHWYESAGGVLGTFVLPVLALIAFWRLRWRTRITLLAIALPSLLLMVGSYRPTDPPPSGHLLLAAYKAVPSLSSFRNTYKAGSGLMIAVSILVGVGASALGAWAARRSEPWLKPAGAALLVGLIGVGSLPMWNGGLYPTDKTMEGIPAYWTQAAAYLDRQPGDARVLVLPGSTQTAYRWGWAGDDILDSLFRRHPNVVPTNFPVSGAITANIVDAIERRAAERTLTPDMLVAIAQRLGVGWVLVRNDLDWERIREPRPSSLDPLRGSRTLPLEKTFGARGLDTTARDDTSEIANTERRLPPIELYRVPGMADGQQLSRPGSSPLIVDGDGGAWPTLAENGDLDGHRPLRFAGAASDAQIADALVDGASLVVTDTNRRRLTLIRGPGPTSSETLAAAQDLAQAPQDLFAKPDTQSVAVYPGALEISSSGSGSDLTGFTASLRAANAFDGLATTAWRDGGLNEGVGVWLKVKFRSPRTLSQVTVRPWLPKGDSRRITKASLHFDDGSSVPITLPKGEAEVPVSFSARRTQSLTIRVDGVRGRGTQPVGFTDIVIPGLDLTEYIATPTHLFHTKDARLRSTLATADVSYLFRRSLGRATDAEELRLRRQFTTAGRRSWSVTARLTPKEPPLDRIVDALVGGKVGAYGTSRVGTPSSARGGLAVDDDPDTGWAGRPKAGENLTVRFPKQSVDKVAITLANGPGDYPAQQISVKVGSRAEKTVKVVRAASCGASACRSLAAVEIPSIDADKVKITLADGDGGGRPVRITDVAVSGPDGTVPRARAPLPGVCTPGVVDLDGTPVPMRSDTPILAALDDGTVSLTSCGAVRLAPGLHRLASTANARVDEVRLRPTDVAASSPHTAALVTARVLRRDPATITVAVDAEKGGVLVSGQSYDPHWQATAGGRSLGTPFEVEGQSAWILPAGTSRVQMRYGPQRLFSVALAVSAAGLIACAVLLLRPRRA